MLLSPKTSSSVRARIASSIASTRMDVLCLVTKRKECKAKGRKKASERKTERKKNLLLLVHNHEDKTVYI